MMLSIHILKPLIRRPYISKVSGCCAAGGGVGDHKIERIKSGIQCTLLTRRNFYQTANKNYNKMLQTFEECVFQPIGRKFISSADYDNRKLNSNNYQNNGQNGQTASTDKINTEQQKYCKDYEEAVKTLNTLQSNAESLKSSTHKRKILNSLEDTQKYLQRSGLTIKDLEKLSYIHVSGTKGKGSTCALTDSILRSYGVKTGFFSSPHLVSLTERIRINGHPISKQKLSQYFWPVYHKLHAAQEYENDMPAYFKFITILCFHIYLAEKVDAVILEVGIGGELDSTNVVPNTKTVGITSLGLEHTQILGDTLKEIAWQKAGIIKPNSTVYTSVTQQECWEVIQERAKEKNATVYRVPQFDSYFQDAKTQTIKDRLNNVILLNGSLAIQLAYDWLRQNKNGFRKEYEANKPMLTEQAIMGLLNCNWPGRCQRVKFFNFNIHLDGAHTTESMQVCGDWFSKVTSPQTTVPKILIFNTTGERDSKNLLNILRNFSSFDLVCFVPNIATLTASSNSYDTQSVLYNQVEQLKRAQMHSSNWQELCQERGESNTAKVFPSILQCFQHIRQVYDKSAELNVLVTGSIHLIGATILSLNELCKELGEDQV